MTDNDVILDNLGDENSTSQKRQVLRFVENLSEGKAINENDIPTKIIKLAKSYTYF